MRLLATSYRTKKKHTLLFFVGMVGYVLYMSIMFGFMLFILLTTVVLALAVCIGLAS